MKARTLALLGAVLSALLFSQAASAHVAEAKGSFQHRLKARVAHDRGVIAAIDAAARRQGSAMFVEYGTWLTRQWHSRDLARAKAALFRLTRPAHYNGWLCIHRLEGSWRDDGAPYYGGLQMSEGWMGVVYHANALSPLRQMQLAEVVSARHGFSYSWMRGQWPNTFPPCARHF